MNKTSPPPKKKGRGINIQSGYEVFHKMRGFQLKKNSELFEGVGKCNTCMKKKSNKNYLGNEPDVRFNKKFKVSVIKMFKELTMLKEAKEDIITMPEISIKRY